MSRQRRQILQLNDGDSEGFAPSNSGNPYNNDQDYDDDDDGMDEMPTPERLVSQDPPPMMMRGGGEIDNKVANFLAEIDALDPGPDENSRSPAPMSAQDREDDSPPHFYRSPPQARERSPAPRTKPGAYSNMFVKGTPEFTKTRNERKPETSTIGGFEPWPEEPKSDWQQLMDEKSNYPYYWNMHSNEVVWDMPPHFSSFLILQKEYQEKVERGLREGKLDPRTRPTGADKDDKKKGDKDTPPEPQDGKPKTTTDATVPAPSTHTNRHGNPDDRPPQPREGGANGREGRDRDKKEKRRRRPSYSEDSSSDSEDSVKLSKSSHKSKSDRSVEMPSSSTSGIKDIAKNIIDKNKRVESPDLPDSTDDKADKAADNDDSIDFDIDDIDKELELALERKRQELMKIEEKKKEGEEKNRDKKSDHKSRDEDTREDRHRHDDDRKRHKHRDRDRDRKHHNDNDDEPKKPKLTLKERLKNEMELKLEKERRKKRAIEELMARELEKTVVASKSSESHKRPRDPDRDEPRKRYRDDDFDQRRHEDDHNHPPHQPHRGHDDYGDYRGRGGYDPYPRDHHRKGRGDRHAMYDDRAAPTMKPPPPTAEMLAYEEERRSQVVDYGHGRSKHGDHNGESDPEDSRSADLREIEMKKLEALQLAELALSKMEFLEVTKKGLSKLQILLIELETRHQDWQSGGLTTNHFLSKLCEANWQLEQYEGSAAPTGWACSWDRDYRRYFYTHKLTGKTQWDYPDADEIKTEDEKSKDRRGRQGSKELDHEISSTSDRGKDYKSEKPVPREMLTVVPPPPPPSEDHPSVKGLVSMYGSTSESEGEAEDGGDKGKKKVKTEPAAREMTPPLPPLPKGDKPDKDKKDRSKSKKKKKEKKKKDKDREKDKVVSTAAVGPMLPVMSLAAPPPPPPEPPTDPGAVYTDTLPQGDQPPPPGAVEYPVGTDKWFQQQTEVPVYGPTSDPEVYGQNDQPLEFGSVGEAGYPLQDGMDYSEMGDPNIVTQGPQMGDSTVVSQGPQVVSHPPEPYDASANYPNPYGASNEVGTSEAVDGAPYYDMAPVPSTEEKKKKKKEKMGSASISLKKKHVSSMVMKWQKVKKEVELEERAREIKEDEIRRKLAELE